MQAITTVGLDIAKSVFQVHGVDATGTVLMRRQLKRRHVLPFFERLAACVVGMPSPVGASLFCDQERVARLFDSVPSSRARAGNDTAFARVGFSRRAQQAPRVLLGTPPQPHRV
jgi:hypothetical protein